MKNQISDSQIQIPAYGLNHVRNVVGLVPGNQSDGKRIKFYFKAEDLKANLNREKYGEQNSFNPSPEIRGGMFGSSETIKRRGKKTSEYLRKAESQAIAKEFLPDFLLNPYKSRWTKTREEIWKPSARERSTLVPIKNKKGGKS
jgi:hypothetical protein